MPRATIARWLRAEWLLVLSSCAAVGLAIADPQPWRHYQHWLQLPTLAGLLGLLIAIGGIRDSGMVQRAALALVTRVHSQRALALRLVAITAVLSMALTNDVSLFLLVPITVAIGATSNLPVLRMVVLEALAVNAGSTLSPIGNPQNLLLWQAGSLSFAGFAWRMLPTALVMLALLAATTALLIPGKSVQVDPAQLDRPALRKRLGTLSIAALAGMIAMIELHLPLAGAAVLLIGFALAARSVLARLDWLLLATFAALFIAIGHLAALPWISHALGRFDFHQPLTLYAGGVLASQIISNVPAALLLLDRAHDPTALAIAVDVGGFGLVIGSLANLIALRLANQPQARGLWLFHAISVPFLLVCAPLVYLVQRWLS